MIKQTIKIIHAFLEWFKQSLTTSQKTFLILLSVLSLSSILFTIIQIISIAYKGIYYRFLISIIFGVVFQAIHCFKNSDDVYVFSPLLYSLEYLAVSVFVFNMFIFLFKYTQIGSLPSLEIELNVIMVSSFLMIFSTLTSFVALKELLKLQDVRNFKKHHERNNAWFNFTFYCKSVNTIASIFTFFAFILLMKSESEEKYIFSVIGTVICFYALITNIVEKFIKNRLSRLF